MNNSTTRKIQKFAKYSHAITLPVSWIKKHALIRDNTKNQEDLAVNIFENPDGSLAIYPISQSTFSPEDSIFILELDDILKENPNFIDENGISLILISYYMNGAHGVEIQSKHPIPQELITQIERIQQRLLFNWNLSRVSPHKLLIKNVFTETPENIFQKEIPRYLRESFSVILWMLDDIHTAVKTDNFDNLADIPKRDETIDRYYFFIVRQIRTIFERPQISKPLNYSHKKMIDLRLLAKIIEDVGDSLKDIAGILPKLDNFFRKKDVHDFLLEYFEILQEAFKKLADILRESVSEPVPKVGLNPKIMQMIYKYRKLGRGLNIKWENLIATIEVNRKAEQQNFQEYYLGATLLKNLEEIFKKIFDFTNIFF